MEIRCRFRDRGSDVEASQDIACDDFIESSLAMATLVNMAGDRSRRISGKKFIKESGQLWIIRTRHRCRDLTEWS